MRLLPRLFAAVLAALLVPAGAFRAGASIASDPQMVRIPARPEFAFRADLTNHSGGEAAPISNNYYLCAYPVTNEQYAVFTSVTGHRTPGYWNGGTYPEGKARHPVLGVSYTDATAYCAWLSTQSEQWDFRLPTEAEWENAALGTLYDDDTVKYPNSTSSPSYDPTSGTLTASFQYNGVVASKLFREYGSDYTVTYIKGDFAGTCEPLGSCLSISTSGGVTNWANHGGTAQKGYFLQTDLYAVISADGGDTAPVDAYAPNTLGLYDMAGNSWDLTSSVITAQNGLEQGVDCYAVRGGSWYATARSCTVSYRGEGRRDSPSATVGFRLAADPKGGAADVRPGDLNADGSIGVTDVVLLMRYLAGGYGVTPDAAAADLNHDGAVNAKDAVLLMRYLAGGYGVTLE